jgi:hypothetical protein
VRIKGAEGIGGNVVPLVGRRMRVIYRTRNIPSRDYIRCGGGGQLGIVTTNSLSIS